MLSRKMSDDKLPELEQMFLEAQKRLEQETYAVQLLSGLRGAESFYELGVELGKHEDEPGEREVMDLVKDYLTKRIDQISRQLGGY